MAIPFVSSWLKNNSYKTHQANRTQQVRGSYDTTISQLENELRQVGSNNATPYQEVYNRLVNQYSGQDLGGGAAVSPQEIQATLHNLYNKYYQAPQYGEQQLGGQTSGGSYSTDTAGLSTLQDQAKAKIAQLNDLYGQIYGDLSTLAGNRRTDIQNQYQQQFGDAAKAYTNDTNQRSAVFGARGLSDSSYLGNSLQQAQDTYNTDVTNLTNSQNSDLAKLGDQINSKQGSFKAQQAGINAINPGAYNTSTDLQSILQNLDSTYQNLTSAKSGLMSDPQLIDALNQIAPAKQQTSSELAKQLQTLVTSSAPAMAKEQIAKGIISRANLQDANAQSFWQDYFQKLLSGQSPAVQ